MTLEEVINEHRPIEWVGDKSDNYILAKAIRTQVLEGLEEEIEKAIERHKWDIAKYVIHNKTFDVGQSSKDLGKILTALVRSRL